MIFDEDKKLYEISTSSITKNVNYMKFESSINKSSITELKPQQNERVTKRMPTKIYFQHKKDSLPTTNLHKSDNHATNSSSIINSSGNEIKESEDHVTHNITEPIKKSSLHSLELNIPNSSAILENSEFIKKQSKTHHIESELMDIETTFRDDDFLNISINNTSPFKKVLYYQCF